MSVVWVKDAVSQAPRTVYTAPDSALPIVQVVYDPNDPNPWTIKYASLSDSGTSTQADIETVMGLAP